LRLDTWDPLSTMLAENSAGRLRGPAPRAVPRSRLAVGSGRRRLRRRLGVLWIGLPVPGVSGGIVRPLRSAPPAVVLGVEHQVDQ
jgi:hypothetical protein